MSRSLALVALSVLIPLGVSSASSAGRLFESGEKRVSRPGSRSPAERDSLPPAIAIRRAAVNGKYHHLLAVISVPQDEATYTAFADYGQSSTTSWGGYSGLPPAYWVYVAPHWYLWKDQSTEVPDAAPVATVTDSSSGRNWGPEQATGEPDTDGPGDITTAWASRTQDEQDEWLELEYDAAFKPTGVIVHETLNPGALNRITLFQSNTEETDAWRGTDPTTRTSEHGVSLVPVNVGFQTKKIRLYLASRDVPGWNEIDAVGLIDSRGKTHWAVHATASSTYAEQDVPLAVPNPPAEGAPIIKRSPRRTIFR